MREHNFRWMVVLKRGEEVVDSAFGGSNEFPISDQNRNNTTMSGLANPLRADERSVNQHK
jgi:hypothetical protein